VATPLAPTMADAVLSLMPKAVPLSLAVIAAAAPLRMRPGRGWCARC
jgi:hypothetical protein